MAIAQGGATGGTTKSSAVDNYWKNYSKYNAPATVTKKATTPKKATVTKKTIIPTTTKTPTTQATTPKSTTPIVATNDRDIGTEIAAELAKGNVDWNKLSGLASERNSKITSNNITGVESTEDMINRLYGQQGSSDSATPTIAGTAETAPANLIAGTPAIVATAKIEPEVDAQAYIDQLLAAKRESQYAALEKSKNNALENLDNEAAGIEPAYYNKRNEVGAQSDVGALNFAQYMAGRGIKGNAGAMPEIYRNSALQGNIGKLNQQEQAAKDSIARDRTGIQNAYESDYAAAGADIDAQGLQAYINQMNADRAYNQQQQQYDDTQLSQQKQDYVDTINRFSDNYQAEIDNITNDNDTTNDWQIAYLQSARQQKLQTQAEQTAAQAAAASATDKEQYKTALELWKTYGTATAEIAAILGVDVGAKTADYDIDRLNAATSAQNANTASRNADTSATKAAATNVEDSTEYQEDYNGILSNPSGSYNLVVSNAAALISAYGQTAYNKLLALAKSTDPTYGED